MLQRFRPSKLSLRVKLVLSYLLVTLAAILVMTFTIALTVQNYFTSTQLDELRARATQFADQFAGPLSTITTHGGPGNTLTRQTRDPDLIVVADTTGRQLLCTQPASLLQGNCNDPTVKAALARAVTQGETHGYLQVSSGDSTFSSLYISEPINYDGNVVGALFLSQPEIDPNTFLQPVNKAILISGILVSAVVILFSLLITRLLTRPVEALTVAAEQMKRGKYTERVAVPKTQDELGQLALTFNAMADTIESDVNELRRQDGMRRELIANIAHDLATPLTAVQGFSEALADDLISKPEARHETAQLIGREVQRLRRLVADMQQMSSLESGQIKLDLAPLDMYELVDETLAVLTSECEEAGIQVHNKITPNTPLVLADSDRITQVLLNLLDNARRHTPRGGTITVSAQREEKMLKVSIQDTGVGIDAKDLPRIFERFYRADRSRTGATGGSGLGLSIVKAILTAHQGNIGAESTPGQGTCVWFTLPLAPQSA